ncbi:hypothetical protein CALCODRAFT_497206 [Calocera cornea HHB12733]|uniref:Uncharacterized protein n=1 Tax=Calocera cornea HHB12733 TaxID=1353952 RepID=A0A165FD18_9BASI|nr:hypothetical protein CALCODRAFT_497206 [Calocera cornea HHB12733]
MKRGRSSSHGHSRGSRGRGSRRGRSIPSGVPRREVAVAPAGEATHRLLTSEVGPLHSYPRGLFLRDLERLRDLSGQILGNTHTAYQAVPPADLTLSVQYDPRVSPEAETARAVGNSLANSNLSLLQAFQSRLPVSDAPFTPDNSSFDSAILPTASLSTASNVSSITVDKAIKDGSHPVIAVDPGCISPAVGGEAPHPSLSIGMFGKDSGSLAALNYRGVPSQDPERIANRSGLSLSTGSLLDRSAKLQSRLDVPGGTMGHVLSGQVHGRHRLGASNLDPDIASLDDTRTLTTERDLAIRIPTSNVDMSLPWKNVNQSGSESLSAMSDTKTRRELGSSPSDVAPEPPGRLNIDKSQAKSPNWRSRGPGNDLGQHSADQNASFASQRRPVTPSIPDERRTFYHGSSDGRQEPPRSSSLMQSERNSPPFKLPKLAAESILSSRQPATRGSSTSSPYEAWRVDNASYSRSYVGRREFEVSSPAAFRSSHEGGYPYSPQTSPHYATPRNIQYQDRSYEQYTQRESFGPQQDVHYMSPSDYSAVVDGREDRHVAYHGGGPTESQYSARIYPDDPYTAPANPAIFTEHATREISYLPSRAARPGDFDGDGGSTDHHSHRRHYRRSSPSVSTDRQYDDFTDYTPLDRRQFELPYH